MAQIMADNSSELQKLLERSSAGDAVASETLHAQYMPKLRRMVEFRLDRRLQGRIDPSDVLQESWLEILQRLPEYQEHDSIPFLLWIRLIVRQKIVTLHRHHLQVKQRDARRDVSLFGGPLPVASSAALAARLVGSMTSVSEAVIRSERILHLENALNAMREIDREVLVLRHFEHLSRDEAALELGISPDAASKRYIRALSRLKNLLDSDSEGE